MNLAEPRLRVRVPEPGLGRHERRRVRRPQVAVVDKGHAGEEVVASEAAVVVLQQMLDPIAKTDRALARRAEFGGAAGEQRREGDGKDVLVAYAFNNTTYEIALGLSSKPDLMVSEPIQPRTRFDHVCTVS